ncbi:MAG: GTP-binding protein, partial [Actinomycetota bacterium]
MSVIDVPGHERFVRNMVAGATGIDIFLLVVAADDGVMPQTREHMAIIGLLGIPRGAIAVTKADLAEAEMVELVKADIEDFLVGTPYTEAPVIPVSSKSGEGLPLLLGALEELAGAAEAHSAGGIARLPVDRVFSLKGIGTVVTGTLWSGEVCVDDRLNVLPDGIPCRARSVQVHDQAVECAGPGQRVALNLTGIEKEKLSRGQMIVKGEGLEPSYMVDARITLLGSAPRPLKYGAQARFHHGTADATCKLMFSDRERLAPGDSCFAQIRLRTKIVPGRGDRFILRSLSPVTTIGGGTVIDPHPRKHGRGEEHQRRLETLEKGSPGEITSLLLAETAPGGLTAEALQARSGLCGEAIAEAAADPAVAAGLATASGSVIYFTPAAVADFRERMIKALEDRQKSSPADPSLPAEELAKAVGMKAAGASFQAQLAAMVDENIIAAAGQRYSLATAEAMLSDSQQQLLESLAAALSEAALAPPSPRELAEKTGAGDSDFKLAVKLLEEDGRLIKVKSDLYFATAAVAQAREALIVHCREMEKITLAEFRDT